LAHSDDILVSPETQQLITPYFETQALEAITARVKRVVT